MSTPAPLGEQDRREALLAALVELEHHVAEGGWDAPPRLFALVETDALALAEPDLARALGLRTTADGASPGALTAIEQDTFAPTDDLLSDLGAIEWPDDVFGTAVATVRTFLPSSVEVSTATGAITLPLVVTDMPDHVVWVPLNSPGSQVHSTLGVSPGAVVQVRAAGAAPTSVEGHGA